MKLKAMTFALFAAGLLAGLTLIAPATGADPPTTTSGTTTVATTTTVPTTTTTHTTTTTPATTTTPTTTTTPVTYTSATDAISALSATSITVGPLTCSIGSSPTAGDFKVGNRVRMYCANGVLFQIKADTPTPPPTTTATATSTTTTTTPSTNYTTATDAITALSAMSITVGSLTCSIGNSSPKAGDFKVGDRARIYCASGVLAYLIRPDAPATTTTTSTPTTTTTSSTNYTNATDAIKALSATSITVGPLTCSIGSTSPGTGDFKVGDRAQIYCASGVLAHLIRPDTTTTTTTATTSDHHDDLTTRLGTISALNSASITVDGLTCSINTSSPSVSAFKVGDQVGIGCTNGVLAKIGTPQVDDGGFKVVVQLGSIAALSTDSITVGKLTCSLAATSPSLASYKVGDRVGVGCAGGILFMIGTLPSTADVPKSEVKHALVQRFNGCIKHGNEHCTVKGILHRLVHR